MLLKHLLRLKKYKNLQLTIIGDATNSQRTKKEKEKILRLISKYNLNNCIKMLGYQPHSIFIKELYKHHIFLSPSIHASDGDTEGGAPVSIIEASASGMPILSTIHCDIPEVVLDRKRHPRLIRKIRISCQVSRDLARNETSRAKACQKKL